MFTPSPCVQDSRLMDEVGSAVLVIAQAKVKLLCTKFLQANHDAAAAQVCREGYAEYIICATANFLTHSSTVQNGTFVVTEARGIR